MQTNLEQIKQAVLHLPSEELEKFDEWYETQKQNKSKSEEKEARLGPELEQYEKARKWIDENGEKYLNQWICLEGDELIAAGDDGRKVYQAAMEKGIKAPFIHYIEKEPEACWGGWL
jgi:hypothetical protein